MKKTALYAVFTISLVFIGDIIYLLIKNAAVSNWLSMIIPSFILGYLAARLLSIDETKSFSRIAAAITAAVKLFLMIIYVEDLTVLAVILSAIIYYLVSYLFIILGKKLAVNGKR